jgi:hypothetical protein
MKEQGHLLTCDGCGQERFLKVISCIPEINECSENTVWKYDYAGFGWIHIFDGSPLGKDYCPTCAKEYSEKLLELYKEAYGGEE